MIFENSKIDNKSIETIKHLLKLIYEDLDKYNVEDILKTLDISQIFSEKIKNLIELEKLVIKNNLSLGQKAVLKNALEVNIPIENLEKIAKSKYTPEQMEMIKEDFEDGIEIERINLYVSELYNFDQTEQMRLGFDNGLSFQEVKYFSDNLYSWQKMREIRYALENHLSDNDIRILQSPSDYKVVKELRLLIERLMIEDPDYMDNYIYKEISKGLYDEFQLEQIRIGLEEKIEEKKLKVYVKSSLTHNQMAILRDLFRNGINIEEVNALSSRNFNFEKLKREARKLKRIKNQLSKNVKLEIHETESAENTTGYLIQDIE